VVAYGCSGERPGGGERDAATAAAGLEAQAKPPPCHIEVRAAVDPGSIFVGSPAALTSPPSAPCDSETERERRSGDRYAEEQSR